MHPRPATLIAAALAALFLAGATQPSFAIPVFARKYGFDCTMCHVQFPKLNDFGQRYRDNGYQVPGQETMDKSAIDTMPPIALRTQAGYVSHSVSHVAGDADKKEFNIGGLDLLSAGLFKQDIGFFAIYTPRLDPAKGGDSQTGRLEMANVIFNRIGNRNVSLRVGRFEPSFLGHSAKRSWTFSGYEVYDFMGKTEGNSGGFALSDTQEGLEVGAQCPNGWHGFAGWVNGSQNRATDKSPADVYARVYKVFGDGEGQTAGQRLGIMGYHGKARIGDPSAGPQYNFNRWGVDASINIANTNLMAQYIKGRDDKGFNAGVSDYDWSGGFVQVDHALRSDIIAFGRYDWVNTPAAANNDIKTWVIGGRWNIEKNLAAHIEYANRKQDNPIGPRSETKDLYLRLDMAF